MRRCGSPICYIAPDRGVAHERRSTVWMAQSSQPPAADPHPPRRSSTRSPGDGANLCANPPADSRMSSAACFEGSGRSGQLPRAPHGTGGAAVFGLVANLLVASNTDGRRNGGVNPVARCQLAKAIRVCAPLVGGHWRSLDLTLYTEPQPAGGVFRPPATRARCAGGAQRRAAAPICGGRPRSHLGDGRGCRVAPTLGAVRPRPLTRRGSGSVPPPAAGRAR